jgi:antitoxin component YwqK of YwqJK toxin-antitoxin module
VKRFRTYNGEVEIVEVCQMLHGDKTEWDVNGNKRLVTPYFCGEIQGTVRGWHRNGERSLECDYEHDKKEGWCREWDDEGHREIEAHYRNNVKDGMEIGYWIFGDEIDYEVQWANGKPVGKSRLYAPEGFQYRETVFDDNGLKKEDTYFHRNGRMKKHFLFEDEELIVESSYTDEGRLIYKASFWTAKESPDKTHKTKKAVKYGQNNDILSLLEKDINGVVTKRYHTWWRRNN